VIQILESRETEFLNWLLLLMMKNKPELNIWKPLSKIPVTVTILEFILCNGYISNGSPENAVNISETVHKEFPESRFLNGVMPCLSGY